MEDKSTEPTRDGGDEAGVAGWEPGSKPPEEPPAEAEGTEAEASHTSRSIPGTRIFAIVVSVLALIALFWIGGEIHYQGCVDAVAAKTQGANDNLTRLVRANAVEKCTRSPF